jgi:hypothetical protein
MNLFDYWKIPSKKRPRVVTEYWIWEPDAIDKSYFSQLWSELKPLIAVGANKRRLQLVEMSMRTPKNVSNFDLKIYQDAFGNFLKK